MKNLQLTTLGLIASFFFASCSSDDEDNGGANNEPITGNYFPLTDGDIWAM